MNPVELALDAGEDVVAHVGEDGGEQAALLELLLPGEHGGVLRGPHAGVPVIQLFDRRRARWLRSGIAEELLPEGKAGELALVVGVAIGPVERSQSGRVAGR